MKLVVGTVPSEFEIQASIFSALKARGEKVRGEVRCTIGGKKVRFDLLVFDGDGSLRYAVEVKPKRSKAWRDAWSLTQQCERYKNMPIPVFMVCGQHQADKFIDAPKDSSSTGIVWFEQWAA